MFQKVLNRIEKIKKYKIVYEIKPSAKDRTKVKVVLDFVRVLNPPSRSFKCLMIFVNAKSGNDSFCLQVSECSKSEGPSLSTSPGSDFLTSPAHRSVPLTSRHFSRTSSRASQNSLQSPSKSTGSSPPKTGSSNSLNKFHNRLVDKLKRSIKKADDTAEDQRNLS